MLLYPLISPLYLPMKTMFFVGQTSVVGSFHHFDGSKIQKSRGQGRAPSCFGNPIVFYWIKPQVYSLNAHLAIINHMSISYV